MNKIRHVVFIVPTFNWPAPRTIRARKIAEYLSDNFFVTIICFSGSSSESHDTNTENLKIIEIPYSPVSRFLTLRRYGDFEPKRLALKLLRPLSYVLKRFYLFPDAWALEKKKILNTLKNLHTPVDTIVASMMPFSTGKIATEYKYSVAKVADVRVVCDIGDPLTNNVVKTINFRSDKLYRYERSILKACDHIVVTNIGTLNHYKDAFQIAEKKISCIPQGADTNNQPQPYMENPASEKIQIFYAGIFLANIREPGHLFEALRKHTDLAKLKVCGSIDEYFKTGNDFVEFCGEVSHSQVYKNYHSSDCVLFIDNSYGLQTSGKIYELLALRIPILFLYTDTSSPLKLFCEQFGHVIFIENTQPSLDSSIGNGNLGNLIAVAESWLDSDSGAYDTSQFSWETRAREFERLI